MYIHVTTHTPAAGRLHAMAYVWRSEDNFGEWFSLLTMVLDIKLRFMWQTFWPTEVIVWAQSQPLFHWRWGTKPRTLNILGRHSPPSAPSFAYKNSLFSTVPHNVSSKDLMKYSVSPGSDVRTRGVHRWILSVLFSHPQPYFLRQGLHWPGAHWFSYALELDMYGHMEPLSAQQAL